MNVQKCIKVFRGGGFEPEKPPPEYGHGYNINVYLAYTTRRSGFVSALSRRAKTNQPFYPRRTGLKGVFGKLPRWSGERGRGQNEKLIRRLLSRESGLAVATGRRGPVTTNNRSLAETRHKLPLPRGPAGHRPGTLRPVNNFQPAPGTDTADNLFGGQFSRRTSRRNINYYHRRIYRSPVPALGEPTTCADRRVRRYCYRYCCSGKIREKYGDGPRAAGR